MRRRIVGSRRWIITRIVGGHNRGIYLINKEYKRDVAFETRKSYKLSWDETSYSLSSLNRGSLMLGVEPDLSLVRT